MTKIAKLVFVLILSSSIAAWAADSTQVKTTDWNLAYDSLLQRVRKADTTVDFHDLRIAYSKSSLYNPYGDPGPGWRDSMVAARQREDLPAIMKFASKVLDSNYVDIDAHLLLGYAYSKQNDYSRYGFERWVSSNLLKSIFSTGNGKNLEWAYQVISVDEEHTLISLIGYRIIRQSLTSDSGHHYDRFELENPSDGRKEIVFFNIDIQMQWVKSSSRIPKAG
jgi:hypothetical protein